MTTEAEKLSARVFLEKTLRVGVRKAADTGLDTVYPGIEKYLFLEFDGKDLEELEDSEVGITDEYEKILTVIAKAEISVNDAWEIAKRNTAQHARITTLEEKLKSIDPGYPADDESAPIYIITTDTEWRGAGAATCAPVLDDLRKRTGAKRTLVIPSSIHEMLAIPDPDDQMVSFCKGLVKEVNAEQVKPEERLTDTAYLLGNEVLNLAAAEVNRDGRKEQA